jgi:coenzyme F420-reducing hydrogenase gamma subunit
MSIFMIVKMIRTKLNLKCRNKSFYRNEFCTGFFTCFLSKIITVTKAMPIIFNSINLKTCVELGPSMIQFIRTRVLI